MQALVIYDNQGNIWNITYGDTVKPESLASARLEIPDGSQLTGVDLSNPKEPKAVFESMPASDYVKLQNQIQELEKQLTEQKNVKSALEDELTNTQLALTELYERLEV